MNQRPDHEPSRHRRRPSGRPPGGAGPATRPLWRRLSAVFVLAVLCTLMVLAVPAAVA